MKRSVGQGLFLGLAVMGGLSAATAVAASDFELVSVAAKELFVPVGFDDNDEAIAVLDGFLPSSCYKLDVAKVDIDEASGKILIDQLARKYPGPCAMALVPFTNTVTLGVLPVGKFSVSTRAGALSEELKVSEATSMGPDDFLYAPIDSILVHQAVGTNQYFANMAVRLTSSCMKWVDYEFHDHGKSMIIQPKIEIIDRPVCTDEEKILNVLVPLPSTMYQGRHLLHTRSLNGKSVNVVFSVNGQRFP